jgi:TolA-binding protein
MIRNQLPRPVFFGMVTILSLLGSGAPSLLAQGAAPRATPIQPNAGPSASATPEALDTRLRFANMLYNYQKYEGARDKYIEFLNALPSSPEAPDAWFRLGDCHRRLNANEDAIRCLSTYLKLQPKGEFAAVAAFSLARIHFNADRFSDSLPYWAMAGASLKDPAMKAETDFFFAQASQLAGQIDQAITAYEKLLNSKTEHRYRERAELEVARLCLESKDGRDKARVHFENLANTSKDPDIKDEAVFRAGILYLETPTPDRGEALLRETLTSSKNDSFKQLAQMALMQKAYEKQNYQEVVRLYSLAPLTAQGIARAQLDLMVGNSQRQLGKLGEAVQIFGQVAKAFPGTDEATEAGYRKLLCLHQAADKELVRSVDDFIHTQSAADAASHYIDLALLLKGEALFAVNDFKGAAEAYRNVRPENVDAKYAPARLYKMGWAMIDSGTEPEGIAALEEFIKRYSLNPLVPSAIMKMAITHHQKENFPAALKDYQRIVKDHGNSENAEYALTQIALIHRHLRQLAPMVAAYQGLIEKFPKTKIKPEAVYWIGGGLFDLKKYPECIAPLREARSLDDKAYGENASVRIVFALYHMDDLKGLLEETRSFRAAYGDKTILEPVFTHLGRAFFDAKDYGTAEPYLMLRSTPEKPKDTPPDIWRKLADVHLFMKKPQVALADLDHFLAHQPGVNERSRAMLDKAKCYLQIKDPKNALASAEEVLRLVRAGPINNEARVLIGDICMAQNDPVQAIQYYTIVVEFGADRVMVPLAMSRMATALEAKGDADRAAKYRKQLAADFPEFKAEDHP